MVADENARRVKNTANSLDAPARAPVMTPRQRQALDFITAYCKANGGVGPSFREVAAHLGIKSVSYSHSLLLRMEKQGLVTWIPSRAHSLRPTGRCPCCGKK
jgi:SOS-response transcriptional repressor LexA